MSNGEQGEPSQATETALLTAFVTLVLATGSAFVWRSSSNKQSLLRNSSISTAGGSLHALSCEQTCIMPPRPKPMKIESSDSPKQVRSKERRRRGKDPLKELLKAERKGKTNTKTADDETATLDIGQNRERSNSVSTASSSRYRSSQEHVSPFISEADSQNNDDSTSASTSASASTADTSPQSSLILTPEPVIANFDDVGQDPWDWDGNSSAYSSTTNESPQKKPPRFRSRSRQPDVSKASGSSSETLSFPTLNTSNGGAKTPHRTPTPSISGTPPPSLTVQTQLASLKGALEAARLREDKMKRDLEKYQKEMEMLKWDNRRRESELQSQIQGLLHQLQAYSMLASAPFSPLANHNTATTMNPPSMFPTSSPASPAYHHSHSHTWVPQSNLMSPTHPPSPYLSQQQHLYSAMFANSFPSASSSPSTSSPDLSGRGRRRGRGGNANATDDGWVLTSSLNLKGESAYEHRSGTPLDFGHHHHDGGDDDEVNSLLLDAIMKRPETMRSNTSNKTSPTKGRSSPLEELTFPSIADSIYSTKPTTSVVYPSSSSDGGLETRGVEAKTNE